LLSAQKGVFEEELGKQAIKLYQKAPNMPPRPGASGDPKEQAQLANVITGMKPEQVEEFNTKWKEKVTNETKFVQPILSYRDELFARLPRTYEAFRAGYEDALERAKAGYDTSGIVKRVNNDLRAQAAGMKPVEIGKLAALVQNYAGKTGATVNTELEVKESKDKKTKTVAWKATPMAISQKDCDALFKDLVEMSKAGF
jgi:hypothetical protein